MKLILTLLYVFIIGFGSLFLGMSVSRDLFDENKFPYKSYKWEKNGKFYNKFRIKKWKRKVPDMSIVAGRMFPKKVHLKMTSEDVDRLIKESCVAEMTHYILSIFSFEIYNIWHNGAGVLLTAIYVILGNVPFIMIQRHNRPNFISLKDKLKNREEKRLNANSGLPQAESQNIKHA